MVKIHYAPHMEFGVLTLIVVLASVLGAVMAVPQALRLVRYRRVEGVSTAWAAMSTTLNAWWVVYGVGSGSWGIVPVSAVSVGAYLVILASLVRFSNVPNGTTIRKFLVAAIGVGLIPVPVLLLGGWAATGVVLGALYGIQLAPAVVAVYRTEDVSGVSAATWSIAWAEALLWGFYGLAHADAGLMTLAATGLTFSTAVLARLLVGRLRGLGLTPGPAISFAR